MLAKIIEGHVDSMEDLEKEFQTEIDKAIAALDIDELMFHPQAALKEAVEAVQKRFEDKYLDRILSNGRKFAKRVQEKDVVVDLSKDADKNDDKG